MSNIDKQALREEFQQMQDHYSDPADRNHQVIYIAAEALLDELEAAEKRIAELEARDINIKQQAQALFEAIANPGDCYIPAYVRCLREALNGNSAGTDKGE
ncbi:hypothetical protein ACPDTC_000202 [Escherichia coli]